MMNSDTRILLSRVPQQLRGPFARWPRVSDLALAIVMFLGSVFVASNDSNQDLVIRNLSDIPISALCVFSVASGALYWRRSQPLIVMGVNLIARLALLMGFGFPDLWAMGVALYSVGRYVNNDQWSYYGIGAALVLDGCEVFKDTKSLADIGFGFVVAFLIWYIGRYLRIRGDYLRLLQEHAEQLEREHMADARRAVDEERSRIARELHDVVAHRVSLMTVQAGAAKTVATEDLDGALRAMEAVEQEGRQALGELRHLLGVLRPEVEANGLGPQPGFADIPRLVEHLREMGLDVTLKIEGVQTNLPARVDLSMYRIVQEALTNVLKHAGPNARTEVRLNTNNREVIIEVLDRGHGVTILPGSGHGIAGMRERAQLLGGSFDAGVRLGGGFQVVAHLPIEEEPL